MRPLRCGVIVGTATALSRLPFASPVLWDHDSVQFALAVEHYDLAAHQPHPPGYPLYVGILDMLAAVGIGPRLAMVGLAVLASGIGACFAALLAAELTSGRTVREMAALAAGVLYFGTPVLWFYGELPLVYAVEAGVAVLLAWLAWRAPRGAIPLLVLCLVYALAGGIRPSTAVLLGPLALMGMVRGLAARKGRRWRLFLAAAFTLAAGGLAWALPLLVNAGGLAAYRRISSEHFGALLPETSILYGAGWPALAHNAEVLVKWSLQGILPATLLVALAAVVGGIRGSLEGLLAVGRRSPFLLSWVAPPVLFFALFHITKAGYILVYLPALLVGAAVAAAPALARHRRRGAILCLLVGLGGGTLFVGGSQRLAEQPRVLAVVCQEFNAGRIRRFARELTAVRTLIAATDPDRSFLVSVELPGSGGAGAEGFFYSWHRHLQWYFPRYRTVLLLPAEMRVLSSRGHQPFRDEGERLTLEPGQSTAWLVLAGDPGDRFLLPTSASVRFRGEDFFVVEAEVTTESTLGPFEVVAVRPEMEGDLLEVDAHVHVLESNPGHRLQVHRGEVQDGAQAGGYQGVEGLLRRCSGHRDHRDAGAGTLGQLAQLVAMVHRQVADATPHFLGVDIDSGDDPEAAVVESGIAGQRPPQMSHADDDQALLDVESQEPVESLGEARYVVAHAPDSELSEVGEVLADLSGGEVIAIRHLLGRDAIHPQGLEIPQAAQIDRKSVQSEG